MMKRNGRNVCSLKMLIGLEAAKGNLRPFHLASGIIALCLLGMLYLLAAIPHFDPADAEEALFFTY